MARIVDNLIADGQIQPVGLAFVENGREARTLEYACAESTLRFLLSRVIPQAGERMRLLDIAQNPGNVWRGGRIDGRVDGALQRSAPSATSSARCWPNQAVIPWKDMNLSFGTWPAGSTLAA